MIGILLLSILLIVGVIRTTRDPDSLIPLIGQTIPMMGVVLLIGNVTQVFPTFPYAGYITVGLGGWLASGSQDSSGY
jgi:hypothetical protein